jgi:hypothetical protein
LHRDDRPCWVIRDKLDHVWFGGGVAEASSFATWQQASWAIRAAAKGDAKSSRSDHQVGLTALAETEDFSAQSIRFAGAAPHRTDQGGGP